MAALRVLERVDERVFSRVLVRDDDLATAGEAALAAAAAELEGLVSEAEALARHFVSLAEREHLVVERARKLDEADERLARREAELDSLRSELERQGSDLAGLARETGAERDALQRDQRQLEKLGVRLGSRGGSAAGATGGRFRARWRAWQRRPHRLGDRPGQACDLLFLPTGEGYELLREDGLALRRGARLVLSPGGPTYSVSKIAPWPFDGRWCAYLQQEP